MNGADHMKKRKGIILAGVSDYTGSFKTDFAGL